MSSLGRIAAGEREPYLPLLLLADDAHDHVADHLDEGTLFIWSLGDSVVGAVQAVARADATELTLVAVDEAHQGRGHGQAMLVAVCDALAADGVDRVVVGTATAGVGQIHFYQRAGFRMSHVERDHFDAARGYDGTETENGLPIRDLVWFDRDLGVGR